MREVTCINYKCVTCYLLESLLWEIETDLEVRLLKVTTENGKEKVCLAHLLPSQGGQLASL